MDEDYENEDPEAGLPIDQNAFMNVAQMGGFGGGQFDDDGDEEEQEEPTKLLTE